MEPLIAAARRSFHETLFATNTLSINAGGVFSNADSSSRVSKQIAALVAEQLVDKGHTVNSLQEKAKGQTAGKLFERAVADFVDDTFPRLQAIRPGRWRVEQLGNASSIKASDFAQYEHLASLTRLTQSNAELRAMLGNDYVVAPDIVVWREQMDDDELNEHGEIVNEYVGLRSALRKSDLNRRPILHASISAKFTMRSDRAQNSRTEALNLIRNRKGHLPHIMVVTAEPMPNRIASLALGTGDIDCVYHFALDELVHAVELVDNDVCKEMLTTLIAGKRLKDISDLPLDLAV